MRRGDNPRFVVTTLPDPPEALYRFYVQRGRPRPVKWCTSKGTTEHRTARFRLP